MQLNIKVVSVSAPEQVKKGRQNYKTLTVVYTKDGKEESKKLVDFTNKDVFEAASKLEPGTNVKVTIEKQGDYWQWTKIESNERQGDTMAEARSTRPSSTFETAEERAKRQIYIVRQSSISSAIEYFKLTEAKKVKPDEILLLAAQFENFVFGGGGSVNPEEVE